MSTLEILKNKLNKVMYALRYLWLKLLGVECSHCLKIESRFIIKNCNKLKLGESVYINNNFWCNGKGGIEIGDDTLIGPNVTIHSSNHNFESIAELIRTQGHNDQKVKIHNNVWLGANVVVLPGSVIKSGCIIGAGSIVRGILEENSVYVGNPIRKIKKLN